MVLIKESKTRGPKMRFKKNLANLGILLLSSSLMATTNSEFSHFIDSIYHTFNGYYAPKSWKEKHFSWDLATEISRLKTTSETISVIDFHNNTKGFFKSMRDYHTRIWFANNASSYLPISLKYIDESFYLAFIDPLIATNCALQVGDKITHFNDQDVHLLAKELMGDIKDPSPTDWSLAAKKLTKRLGTAGDLVEKGPVVIKALRDKKEIIGQLVWVYNANDIKSQEQAFVIKKDENKHNNLPSHLAKTLRNILKHIETRSHLVFLQDNFNQLPEESPEDPMAMGQKESFLSPLGQRILWKTADDSNFQAYIYLNDENRPIGFIRIPSYMPESDDEKLKSISEEFGQIVSYLDNLSDLLVIDQQNNPGGSIFYLYALASMLTDKPLINPRHQFMIDSKDVFEAKEALKGIDLLIALAAQSEGLDSIHGYPIDLAFLYHMKSYYQFIAEQYEQGKTLTDPHFLFGVDYIKPHPLYRYTKKIVVLINELDFSAGDFFAAIMTDSKRATLVGTKTAGAGGYVLTETKRNRVNVRAYNYTGSIAYRPNGDPLENLGISPDISYEISLNDLKTDFSDFTKHINDIINEELNRDS